MRRSRLTVVLVASAAILALGLAALASTLGASSSEAQQGTMHNCPQPYRFSLAVWEGPDDTDAEQAFATCGEDGVIAAYWLVPETQSWLRWFAGYPQFSTLATLDNLQSVSAVGGVGASPPSSVSSSLLLEEMQGCPKHGRRAFSAWPGSSGTPIEQAVATCTGVQVITAYDIDPDTYTWRRWFLGYPESSDLVTLDHMQGIITIAAAAPSPTPTPAGQEPTETPTPTPEPTATPTPTPEAQQVRAEGTFTGSPAGGFEQTENYVGLTFNSAGGPITDGEGRYTITSTTGDCTITAVHVFEGTYTPLTAETGEFKGTVRVTVTAVGCEVYGSPYYEHTWDATLSDGHITGTTRDAGTVMDQFELDVQG